MNTGHRLYPRIVLGMLLLVYTFNFVDRQILGILAPAIKADLGLTDTQLGWLGGPAFALLYSTLAIPLAWVADRTSRTGVIAASLAVWSAFTALCGFAGSFWQLFAARVGVGVGVPAVAPVVDPPPPPPQPDSSATIPSIAPSGRHDIALSPSSII